MQRVSSERSVLLLRILEMNDRDRESMVISPRDEYSIVAARARLAYLHFSESLAASAKNEKI